MNCKNLLLIMVIGLLFSSCNKEKPNSLTTADSFVFAMYNPFRVDSSYRLEPYKIVENNLYTSYHNLTIYDAIPFYTNPLPSSQYLIAKTVQDSFPIFLETSLDTKFGFPGFYDQGIIYIERTINNTKRKWVIDSDTAALPIELKSYALLVANILEDL